MIYPPKQSLYGQGAEMGRRRGESRLRFNCFLLKNGLDDPQQALREPYRRGGAAEMAKLRNKDKAPHGATAYLLANTERHPSWAVRLAELFEGLEDTRNLSNRLIIFLPVEERIFAACFGYGSSALDWSCVEPNFGLRVAARAMSPNAMSELRSRRFDVSARTQQIQVPGGASLRDLYVELEGEFVSRLVGKMESEGILFGDRELDLGMDVGGVLVASDSIAFQSEVDLEKVVRVLRRFLWLVDSTDTREEFRFVDALKPLRADDGRVRMLDAALAAYLFDWKDERSDYRRNIRDVLISFAPPDSIAIADIDGVELSRGNDTLAVADISYEALRETLRRFRSRYSVDDLKKIKVIAYNHAGEPIAQAFSLKNWLVMETVLDSERFILTMGRWFSLSEEFTKKLDSDLSMIRDLTAELNLPPWPATQDGGTKHHEGDYNESIKGPEWVVLDKVRVPSQGTMVEACDLFHVKGHLVHLKRWTRSQTLSHLLAQGSISAELMKLDSDYLQNFVKEVEKRSIAHKAEAEKAPRSVVYAIGAPEGKSIPGDLPTFSKVNLRHHCKRIRSMGVTPGLAKVTMV